MKNKEYDPAKVEIRLKGEKLESKGFLKTHLVPIVSPFTIDLSSYDLDAKLEISKGYHIEMKVTNITLNDFELQKHVVEIRKAFKKSYLAGVEKINGISTKYRVEKIKITGSLDI